MYPFSRLLSALASTLLVATAMVTPAAADDGDIERCRSLESDAERLACYDDALRDASTDTSEPEADHAATGPGHEPGTAGTDAAAAGAAATGAAASAPASASNSAPAADSEPGPGKGRTEKNPKEYTAVVLEMSERPYGQKVVRLDNGEVWSEQYASRAFLVKAGDTVTLKRSTFSSGYRLVAPGGRGYSVTRIK